MTGSAPAPEPGRGPAHSLLPRGWARALLVVVALLVVLGWLIGKDAAPPDLSQPGPPSLQAAPPPVPVPD